MPVLPPAHQPLPLRTHPDRTPDESCDQAVAQFMYLQSDRAKLGHDRRKVDADILKHKSARHYMGK